MYNFIISSTSCRDRCRDSRNDVDDNYLETYISLYLFRLGYIIAREYITAQLFTDSWYIAHKLLSISVLK